MQDIYIYSHSNYIQADEVYFKKVFRLKRYLPIQKWTMNEMLIFSKYVGCSKYIKTETVFTKTEMNSEWNINFFKIWGVFKK